MTVRDDRSDVKQTTTGFRGPLMVQSLTSAKSKFLSLKTFSKKCCMNIRVAWEMLETVVVASDSWLEGYE